MKNGVDRTEEWDHSVSPEAAATAQGSFGGPSAVGRRRTQKIDG